MSVLQAHRRAMRFVYFELDYGRDAAEIMKYNRNGQNSLMMFKLGRKGNWSKSFIVIITDSIFEELGI